MEGGELDILGVILEAGPVVKGVLLVLCAASVLSWAIALKKYAALRAIRSENRRFSSLFSESGSVEDFLERTDGFRRCLYRNLFVEGHREMERSRDGRGGAESVRRAVRKEIHRNAIKLNRHQTVLASIGSITPFVGLFGTVWGIIDSFTGLASGGATLDAVAPGIAEALVATAVGLGAAIPAVWFYNYFSHQNAELAGEMDIFEQEFLNVVERSAA